MQITVTSAELSDLLTRVYDAGYSDTFTYCADHSDRRAHRLCDLIRDWSFQRRLREIAAAGKEGASTDA